MMNRSGLLCCVFVSSMLGALAFQHQPFPTAFRQSSNGDDRHHAHAMRKSTSATTFAPTVRSTSTSTQLHIANLRDPDFLEELVGGIRYEMVPLPDSMVDTTIFVGNLNEFVKDEDLSQYFQAVSVLQSVPACVVRKANYESLGYGFVAFPNIKEKEAAIVRFHGSEWQGKSIKVEEIRDHPKMGRVRVPERIVSYVSGEAKPTRNGQVNTMRRSRDPNFRRQSSSSDASATDQLHQENQKQSSKANDEPRRKSKSQKQKHKQTQKQKRKQQQQQRNSGKSLFPIRNLVNGDLQEFYRASRKGFVTLPGTGYRRGRKACALANTHRQWCDENAKPQIVLCKASGGRPLDSLIVDLSPLRLPDDALTERKAQVLLAAHGSEMELRADYVEDNCMTLSSVKTSELDGLQRSGEQGNDGGDGGVEQTGGTAIDADGDAASFLESLSSSCIHDLPAMSLGVFEGERSKAKAMARQLAQLWDLPKELEMVDTVQSRHKAKQWKKKSHQRRGRNERDLQWYAGV